MQTGVITDVFLNNLLPIFIMAGAGFIMGRALHPDIRSTSRLSFHVFSPCLIFISLVRVGITGGEFGRLALLTFGVSAAIAGLAFLCGWLMNLPRAMLASLMVASAFSNSGNFGLAANKFSFGDEGLARALICFVFGTIWTYTAGIMISSMGQCTPALAFKRLLSVPATYALVAAALIRYTGWQIPLFVERSISLLGEAAIPLMLVILGLQIAEVRRVPWSRLKLISIAGLLQIVVTPILALWSANMLGLSGPARQAAVLQSAMPAAVVTTILALEYDLDADLVTGAVVFTTLVSPLTLTPLIAYLVHTH